MWPGRRDLLEIRQYLATIDGGPEDGYSPAVSAAVSTPETPAVTKRLLAWPRRGDALGLLALTLATIIARLSLFPFAYFHPNGQGPMWVATALGESGVVGYGPGYAELFGWLAGTFSESPERALFGSQALVSALVPAACWGTVRAVGGGRSLAWAAAIVMAADPLAGRLAQSESYFATCLALLTFGVMFLAISGAVRARYLPLTLAAGCLFVVMAARVHPSSWPAAFVAPAVVFLAAKRWRRLILAVAIMAAVALTTSYSAIDGVLDAKRGLLQQTPAWALVFERGAWSVVAAGVGLYFLGTRGAMAVALLGGSYSLLALSLTDVEIGGYPRMFLPGVIAAFAALTSRLPRLGHRVAFVAVAAAGIALVASSFAASRSLPTDALEAEWAREWRADLPSGASVMYLSRSSGHRIVSLPIFGRRVYELRHEGDPMGRGDRYVSDGPVYYYESSLCSIDSEAACKEYREMIEKEAGGLTLIGERRLSRGSSATYLPALDEGWVSVKLFRSAESFRVN